MGCGKSSPLLYMQSACMHAQYEPSLVGVTHNLQCCVWPGVPRSLSKTTHNYSHGMYEVEDEAMCDKRASNFQHNDNRAMSDSNVTVAKPIRIFFALIPQ